MSSGFTQGFNAVARLYGLNLQEQELDYRRENDAANRQHDFNLLDKKYQRQDQLVQRVSDNFVNAFPEGYFDTPQGQEFKKSYGDSGFVGTEGMGVLGQIAKEEGLSDKDMGRFAAQVRADQEQMLSGNPNAYDIVGAGLFRHKGSIGAYIVHPDGRTAPLTEKGLRMDQPGGPEDKIVDYTDRLRQSARTVKGQKAQQGKWANYAFPAGEYQTSKGWQFYNPFNLRSGVPWEGANGTYTTTHGEFQSFGDHISGIRAGYVNMNTQIRRGHNTLTKLMHVLSPSTENKTDKMIETIAARTGIDPTRPLTEADMKELGKAIISIEIGYGQQPYPEEMIEEGYRRAYSYYHEPEETMTASLGQIDTGAPVFPGYEHPVPQPTAEELAAYNQSSSPRDNTPRGTGGMSSPVPGTGTSVRNTPQGAGGVNPPVPSVMERLLNRPTPDLPPQPDGYTGAARQAEPAPHPLGSMASPLPADIPANPDIPLPKNGPGNAMAADLGRPEATPERAPDAISGASRKVKPAVSPGDVTASERNRHGRTGRRPVEGADAPNRKLGLEPVIPPEVKEPVTEEDKQSPAYRDLQRVLKDGKTDPANPIPGSKQPRDRQVTLINRSPKLRLRAVANLVGLGVLTADEGFQYMGVRKPGQDLDDLLKQAKIDYYGAKALDALDGLTKGKSTDEAKRIKDNFALLDKGIDWGSDMEAEEQAGLKGQLFSAAETVLGKNHWTASTIAPNYPLLQDTVNDMLATKRDGRTPVAEVSLFKTLRKLVNPDGKPFEPGSTREQNYANLAAKIFNQRGGRTAQYILQVAEKAAVEQAKIDPSKSAEEHLFLMLEEAANG